jgi:hypothetical protein
LVVHSVHRHVGEFSLPFALEGDIGPVSQYAVIALVYDMAVPWIGSSR